MQIKFISGWKKFLFILTISEVSIILANFVVASFYGIPLRASASWLFGSNNKETCGSLMFLEGAITIGLGALIAAGFSENRIIPLNTPVTPVAVEKLSEQRPELREKQISVGFLLMVIGAPLIVTTILFIIF